MEYQGKDFDGVESGFYTARGEQVRSKSEVLIADALEYSGNALEKIQLYAENGFVLGRNLIFTMESRAVPLNIKYVKKLIKENFCD